MPEFRTPKAAPTNSGFYYGRFCGTGIIEPQKVVWCNNQLEVRRYSGVWGVDEFEWFGPVTQVLPSRGLVSEGV